MQKRLLPLLVAFFLLAAAVLPVSAQVRHEIAFPDLPGYHTLKCDLHSHSVFSDGTVWPTVRVDEAWRLGLDATSLTDHIEYQPHRDDIPTNHSRPFELSAGKAAQMGLLFPRGAEITRDTPPGHFNAIFLEKVEPLAVPDFVEAVRQANLQGAFVFWNHQGWKGEEAGKWLDVHATLFENKWFQGMEVCNGDSYYPTAHRWCLEKNLTMLGNTDIHQPDINDQTTAGNHRTMTLVFAKEKSLAGLKEALLAGRTAVWFTNQMIGRREWLEALLEASVEISPPHYRAKNHVLIMVRNKSDIEVQLQRTGSLGPATATLPPRSTSLVKIGTNNPQGPIELAYTVTNFLIAPGEGLPVTLTVGQ